MRSTNLACATKRKSATAHLSGLLVLLRAAIDQAGGNAAFFPSDSVPSFPALSSSSVGGCGVVAQLVSRDTSGVAGARFDWLGCGSELKAH